MGIGSGIALPGLVVDHPNERCTSVRLRIARSSGSERIARTVSRPPDVADLPLMASVRGTERRPASRSLRIAPASAQSVPDVAYDLDVEADHELLIRHSRTPMAFVLVETIAAAGLIALASVLVAGAVWLPLGLLGLPLLAAALRSVATITRILRSSAPRVVCGRQGLVIHHPELAKPVVLADESIHSMWVGPFSHFGRVGLPGRTWLLGGVFPPDPRTDDVVLVVLSHETDLSLTVRSRFPFAMYSAANTFTGGSLDGSEPTVRLRGLCARVTTPIPPHLRAGEVQARPGSHMPRALAEWLKDSTQPVWQRTRRRR